MDCVYSSRAERPRITVIERLQRRSLSTVLLESRLSPTAISVSATPLRRSTYCVNAGSRIMSLWLDMARNFPSMPFTFSIPSYVSPSVVLSNTQPTAWFITICWNSSTVWIFLRALRKVFTGSPGNRYLETL